MGPLVPDCKNDQSTDSEGEGNVRHDRFKSERYKEESMKSNKQRERQREGSHNRNDSRRRSRRSPSPRCFNSRSSNYPYENEFRKSNHDRREKGHHSKSYKNSRHDRNHSKVVEYKNDTNNKSCKRTLSSILKNFDERLETKHKSLETGHNIGPVMPPELQEKLKNDKELITNGPLNEFPVIGPALPPSFNTDLNIKDEISSVESNFMEETKIEQSKAEGHGKVSQIEGPVLPPHLTQNINSCNLKKDTNLSIEVENSNPISVPVVLNPETDKGVYGPILPQANDKESYGPALPPNFKKDTVQGPSLPEGITTDQLEKLSQEESEDEDLVGPLPEGKMNMTQFQLDLRASHIKRQLNKEVSNLLNLTLLLI